MADLAVKVGVAKFEKVLVTSLSEEDSDSDFAEETLLGVAEFEEGREEVVEHASKTARVAAAVASEHAETGNAAFVRGHYATARGHYTSALRHWPTARVLCNRAVANLALGDATDALRDAMAALHLEPGHVKAHVRAARACQVLDDPARGVSHAQAALALQPKRMELKRLSRHLQAEAAMLAHEQRLLAIARGDSASAAGMQLSSDTLSRMADVVAAVDAAKKTASDGDVGLSAAFRASLPRLAACLKTDACCRDVFVACHGADALLACYAEDNLGTLRCLHAAADGHPRGASALCIAASHNQGTGAKILAAAVGDRRVAVITAALDVCALAAAVPQDSNRHAGDVMRTVLLRGSQSPGLTLLLMCARAPPPVAHRASSVLAACASADPALTASSIGAHARTALTPAAVKLLAPGTTPAADVLHALAWMSVCCTRSALCTFALATDAATCGALLSVLRWACDAAPELQRSVFASGVAMVDRSWSRMPPDAAAVLHQALLLAHRLAKPPSLAKTSTEEVDAPILPSVWDAHPDGDAWPLLVPLLCATPLLRGAALRLADACTYMEPRCVAALAELGAIAPLLEVLAASVCGGRYDDADCAARILLRCAHLKAMTEGIMRSTGASLEQGDGADDAECPGVRSLCFAMLHPGAGSDTIMACATMLTAVAELHQVVLTYLSEQRPGFMGALVRCWYSHSNHSKQVAAIEALDELLSLCMRSEEGARCLMAQAPSEESVLALVTHLRMTRAARIAKQTGGASLLNPASVGLATPFSRYAVPNDSSQPMLLGPASPGGEDGAARTRDAALAAIDAVKLCKFISTLLPQTTRGMLAIADIVASGTGTLSRALADALPAACTVYSCAHTPDVAHQCTVACTALRRVVTVDCTPGAHSTADFTLDALPQPVHVAVAACCASVWQCDDDDAADDAIARQALAAVCGKLRAGGSLVLVEEDINALARLRDAGCAAYPALRVVATPELLHAHFCCVMRME